MPAGKCGKVVCTGDGSRDQPRLETRAWKPLFSNRCNSTVEILEKGLDKKYGVVGLKYNQYQPAYYKLLITLTASATNIIFLNKRVTTKQAQKNYGLTVCFEHVLILSSFGTESNNIEAIQLKQYC